MERSKVDEQYIWKVSDVFADDKAWEKAYSELEKELDFKKYQGTLNTAENILTYFKAEDAFTVKMLRVYLYAFLHHDEDVRVAKYNSYLAKVSNLFTRLGSETAFAVPELTALSDEALTALSKDERLKDYEDRKSVV